jgi:hypothetical protein
MPSYWRCNDGRMRARAGRSRVENLVFRLGWDPAPGQWGLTVLPGALLPAVVLLVAGPCAFPAQRPRRLAPR